MPGRTDSDRIRVGLFFEPLAPLRTVTANIRLARACGVGLNWWANAFFRASINYDHANFTGGAKGGDRLPEDALLGRLQAMW